MVPLQVGELPNVCALMPSITPQILEKDLIGQATGQFSIQSNLSPF